VPSLEQHLFAYPENYNPFQIVVLLERLLKQERPTGHPRSLDKELIRFKANLSISFSASSNQSLKPAGEKGESAELEVNYFGLTGPSGVLPSFYDERMADTERRRRDPEERAMRDWFDLFNHRMLVLFHAAWQKYRHWIPYSRSEHLERLPDTFTQVLYSACGLGHVSSRDRLMVVGEDGKEVLDRIPDVAMLRYAGLLASPKCAEGLSLIISDFFDVPAEVREFEPSHIRVERDQQSRLVSGGEKAGGYNQLGSGLMLGERVIDLDNTIRVRIGPLSASDFRHFLPDFSNSTEKKTFFLLGHLIRFYAGEFIDFTLQLVLQHDEVEPWQLGGEQSQLGWNTWLGVDSSTHNRDETLIRGLIARQVTGASPWRLGGG